MFMLLESIAGDVTDMFPIKYKLFHPPPPYLIKGLRSAHCITHTETHPRGPPAPVK